MHMHCGKLYHKRRHRSCMHPMCSASWPASPYCEASCVTFKLSILPCKGALTTSWYVFVATVVLTLAVDILLAYCYYWAVTYMRV